MSKQQKDLIALQKEQRARRFASYQPSKFKIRDILRWYLARKILPPKAGYTAFNHTWLETIDLSLPGDRIWWIGHATTLIRLEGKFILTDPIFSHRASPSQLFGPKRRTPAAINIAELPQIDYIVISHNHYDHLDYNSIKQIITRFPKITLLVPLGLKSTLTKWGAKQIVELDWWSSNCVNGFTFTATPAKHWSKRGLFDENKALWCGWVIQSPTTSHNECKTVYFMGDTGYSPQLQEIGNRFPTIDLALIPIGAYAPRWFMHSQHIDPQQAIQLYDELHCKSALAIHWGAFELADEPIDEPPELLNSHKGDRRFYLLKIGANLAINHPKYGLK
ncbi:MBL fold metallo-hydrolase [Gilliamella sp. wkB112]|uniref:MBL fold metallo-hydrolase n=1 Tax=Gilliamella sp. wkB112 TaxID=3120257 RepID=UPI00080E90F9|nr:MBL fold metallo-hydrolase [Gilliamella apicola]OCG01147.1 hypothetical protein A9G12_00910 [Gilliamella apicola]